jgi:hypothetical protein
MSGVRQSDGRWIIVVKIPCPGRLDILVTSWKFSRAHAANLLNPAHGRFVVARAKATANKATTLRMPVHPNAQGRQLVKHHRPGVTLRVWVTYTPRNGVSRSLGYYGLSLP